MFFNVNATAPEARILFYGTLRYLKGAAMTPHSTMRPVNILLVEDNPGDVRLTQEALREGKLINTLHVAYDGVEAIDFLRRRGKFIDAPEADIIFLDLNLPRMDGREVLAEIKSDPLLKKIPVIVLTTSSAEEDVTKAYNLHANCYITKPVDFRKFAEIVQSIESFWFSVVKLPGTL
jgi:CheY-like chemotaxis protein